MRAIIYILCGLAVVSPSLLKKHKEFYALFSKYQGWLGVCLVIAGIISVISSLMSLGVLAFFPVIWILSFLGGLVILALGFILGFELIVQYLPKQKAHADKILKKLTPYQKWIGIAAIVIGVLHLIAGFIW